ncbi:hypothetical protein NPIL_230531 [Nephila pilipes]|uniref:Uncharacterized protein n=1 Tax=Nephila pilipes TaxID=299642 RepID=A0A8X6PQA0_NEPPI|nr:hypothetical protein NPIL_230531 [Nephila pilipes]
MFQRVTCSSPVSRALLIRVNISDRIPNRSKNQDTIPRLNMAVVQCSYGIPLISPATRVSTGSVFFDLLP